MLSSLRNFFLALFISVIVCMIGAYFLRAFIDNMMNGLDNSLINNGLSNPNENDPEKTDKGDIENDGSFDEFNILFLGIDDGKSQFENWDKDEQTGDRSEADTIFLLHINPHTQSMMISYLPSDMKVEVGGYIQRLGAVYMFGEYTRENAGMELMAHTVWSYTGVEVDYVCVLDYDSIELLFDVLGEIEYSIPEDMNYRPEPYDRTTTDPPTDPDEPTTLPPPTEATEEEETETTDRDIINLKRNEQETLEDGRKILSGAEIVQLLRYKSYRDIQYTRMSIQLNFIEEAIKQMMTIENLIKAPEIYELIQESIVEIKRIEYKYESNGVKNLIMHEIDENEFEKYKALVFSLSEYLPMKIVEYPGSYKYSYEGRTEYERQNLNKVEKENGVAFFEPIVKSAIIVYRDYRRVERTDKIKETEEEISESAEFGQLQN